jgi:hypothetical protein
LQCVLHSYWDKNTPENRRIAWLYTMIENINVEYLLVKPFVYNVVFHDEK